MKLIALNLLLLTLICLKVSTQIQISSIEYFTEFLKFKKTFKIDFKSPREESTAFGHFKKNYARIKENNLNFAKGLSTFKLSLNPRSAQPDTVALEMSTLIAEEEDSIATHALITFPPTNLTYLNYAELNCSTRVVNQGDCGSSYAFAATGAIELACCKRHGKVSKLSDQQIIDCTSNDDYANRGCAGSIKQSLLYANTSGLMANAFYPATGIGNGTCKFNEAKVAQRIKKYFGFEPLMDEETLKRALVKVGPLIIAINGCSPLFQLYEKGVFYDPNCSTTVNHAVVLVGFGTDKKLGDYWICKNSYGTGWGEKGYFRMTRGKGNHCGMLRQIFTVTC